MVRNAWDGSTATAMGMQMMRSKTCMGLQCLVPASLEAKEKQRHFRECKLLFEMEIDHMSYPADSLSRLRLYPELPKR